MRASGLSGSDTSCASLELGYERANLFGTLGNTLSTSFLGHITDRI
jgi:hypothetical protein